MEQNEKTITDNQVKTVNTDQITLQCDECKVTITKILYHRVPCSRCGTYYDICHYCYLVMTSNNCDNMVDYMLRICQLNYSEKHNG